MSQPPVTPQYQAPPPQKPNTLGLVSMIAGILSIVVACGGGCFLPFFVAFSSPVLAIVAIIVGFMARKEIAAGRQSGSGMATAGIVLGIVALVLFGIGLILRAAGTQFLQWGEQRLEELDREMREQQQQWEQPEPAPEQPEPGPGPATMLRMYGQYTLAMLRIG